MKRNMIKAGVFVIFCVAFILFSVIDYQAKITEEDMLPYFSQYNDTVVRKRQFFEFMRPIIEKENDRVLKQRKQFMALYKKRARGEDLSVWDLRVFRRFAELYQVDPAEYDNDKLWELLKRRIDIVPTELALAQSANESAWGQSRFAIRGNAMFGQWSFSRERKGLVPSRRDPEASHTVATYPTVKAAVKSYIKNLNTHPAYTDFRVLRSQAREEGAEPDGHSLAIGLINYSEKRMDYVREIQSLIETNKSLMNLDLY
ncbi:MAG: glucosaminidase domain-containing protein [bacterium]